MGPVQCSGYSDLLRAGGLGVQSRVWARFSAPVRIGREAHAATGTISTGALSKGEKRPERGVHHPLPCSSEVTNVDILQIPNCQCISVRHTLTAWLCCIVLF